MKAIQLSRFGGPEVLLPVDLPTPVPGRGQVLIRTGAAGINFFESLLRQDRYAVTPDLPTVLGVEVAGTIERLGDGVEGFAVGNRVAAPLFAAGTQSGGYAEHAVIDAGYAVPIPDDLPFEEATALMVQGLTALFLTRQASPAGKNVLVTAAAGGVGSLLVQLARRAGASSVIAAASTTEKLALARSLGADAGIDYSQSGWTEALKEVTGGSGPDLVYESVGGGVTNEGLASLAPQGRLVIYGALNIQEFRLGLPELKSLIFGNLSITGFSLLQLLTPVAVRQALAELFDLAVTGALTVTVGARYGLEQAAEAHRALELRRTTGKVVLVP